MSLEENKAAVRRWIEEGFNQGNREVFDELMANPEKGNWLLDTRRAAFPDWHLVIHDLIAEGDKVVIHFSSRGTHKGEWRGLPPTGNQFDIPVIRIVHFAEGRITEFPGVCLPLYEGVTQSWE